MLHVEQNIAGLDEVARGCLFGPVYAAAVILDPNIPVHEWLNDSKKVTKKRRAVVRQWIEENAVAWSVASCSNEIIDKINIRNAAYLAMEKALRNLKQVPEHIMVDGDYFPPLKSFGKYDDEWESDIPKEISDLPATCTTVVGGDAIYACIAAASILAKEHHDEFIRKLIADDPSLEEKFHLSSNVGYGTAKHIAGIKEFSPSLLHRQSFLGKILNRPKPLSNRKRILFLNDKSSSDEDDG